MGNCLCGHHLSEHNRAGGRCDFCSCPGIALEEHEAEPRRPRRARSIPGELVFVVGLLYWLQKPRLWMRTPACGVRAAFDDAVTLVEHCWASHRRDAAILERAAKASPRRYGDDG